MNEDMLKLFEENAGFTVRSKKMFGGIGVFKDDVMFGMVYDGVAYLKATEEMSGEYVEDGYQFEPPFGRRMKMPYWNVPEELLRDRERFSEWSGKALEYARATKKKKK